MTEERLLRDCLKCKLFKTYIIIIIYELLIWLAHGIASIDQFDLVGILTEVVLMIFHPCFQFPLPLIQNDKQLMFPTIRKVIVICT